MFHFTFSSLMASFIFGVVGLYVFRYGKRESEFPFIFIGLALMIYPYFIPEAWADWGDWGVGFGLSGLAYYLYKY
jgi:hypothetical protein